MAIIKFLLIFLSVFSSIQCDYQRQINCTELTENTIRFDCCDFCPLSSRFRYNFYHNYCGVSFEPIEDQYVSALTVRSCPMPQFRELHERYLYVTSIDMSYNEVGRVDETIFIMRHCRLRRLNMTHCGIFSIVDGSFMNVWLIRELDLSYNKLIYLNRDALRGLISLETLYLSNNSLIAFDFASIDRSRLNILQLDISNNLIEKFDVLSVFEFPKFKEINYTNNRYEGVLHKILYDYKAVFPSLEIDSFTLDDIGDIIKYHISIGNGNTIFNKYGLPFAFGIGLSAFIAIIILFKRKYYEIKYKKIQPEYISLNLQMNLTQNQVKEKLNRIVIEPVS